MSEDWGNVSLVPLPQRAVGVTWVWPQGWMGGGGSGEGSDAVMGGGGGGMTANGEGLVDDLRYQVEYGPLDEP